MVPRERFLILVRYYICHKFQIEYHKNLLWTDSDIFFLAKMWQWHFFLTYKVTGSLGNDRHCDSIPHPPPLEGLFYIPFWTEKVALLYTFHWQMVPLSHNYLSLELCIPFNCCKCTVFKILKISMNDSKTTMFLDFFTALKCICLPFLGLFTDRNDKFCTFPYTSTSEISTPSYTWHLKMVPFLGGASLYSTPGHKQPKLSMSPNKLLTQRPWGREIVSVKSN